MKLLTLALLISMSAFAYPTFPDNDDFRRDLKNPEKDSFCPRLEGAYPPHCCPYKEGAPVQCYYFDDSSTPVGSRSSGTNCEKGVNKTVECCNIASVPCIDNFVQKQFIPRLLKRKDQSKEKCGFEACPYYNYWKNDSNIGKQVTRTLPPKSTCEDTNRQDQCANSGMVRCTALTGACPTVPTPGPQQPPPPGPSPAPSPTPTPTPSPPPNTGKPPGK